MGRRQRRGVGDGFAGDLGTGGLGDEETRRRGEFRVLGALFFVLGDGIQSFCLHLFAENDFTLFCG
jgi:hypothetical protein